MGGPFSGAYCLRFAYNMNGETIGQLNIIHKIGYELNIWYKEKKQGQDWKTDNATVYGNNYYVSSCNYETFTTRSFIDFCIKMD